MSAQKCERCGAIPTGEYELFDYCARCSKNLCPKCAAEGCCGSAPMESGQKADYGDEE